jgi:hypothetical protein
MALRILIKEMKFGDIKIGSIMKIIGLVRDYLGINFDEDIFEMIVERNIDFC